MPIQFDPKISIHETKDAASTEQEQFKTPKAPVALHNTDQIDTTNYGQASSLSPKNPLSAMGPSNASEPLQATLERLHLYIKQNPAANTVQQVLMLCCRLYAFRRASGPRQKLFTFCSQLKDEYLECAVELDAIKTFLEAEGMLHMLTMADTMQAVSMLITGLAKNQANLASDSVLNSLYQATLSRGLLQFASHFPEQCQEQLEMNIATIYEQAIAAAETAITLNPELPDGYVALARAVFSNDDPEAISDALTLAHYAQQLDPQYDPADLVVAVCMRLQGKIQESLTQIDKILQRGNSLPQAFVAKSQAHMDLQDYSAAEKALKRALEQVDESSIFYVDAIRLATLLKQDVLVDQYREQLKPIFGDSLTEVIKDS